VQARPPPTRPYHPIPVFEISVQTEFCAAHALVIAGQKEPVHGHNWRVTATLAGKTLDPDGLLCDFHQVEAALAEVIAPFNNADLNQTPPFTDVNPSAENVAKHIAVALSGRLAPLLAGRADVRSVRVTEAPGCSTTYHAMPTDRR
jgi:6-pyruvoyltetrahydropterin/6-carboxytetrahydropterin synthase